MKKVKGAAAVEWVILVPLMALVFMISMYFLFCCVTHINYSNAANMLAQELNMRQSGYSEMNIDEYDIAPIIYNNGYQGNIYRQNKEKEHILVETSKYINGTVSEEVKNSGKITIGADNVLLKRASHKFINDLQDRGQLWIPGAKIEEIHVSAYKNGKELADFPMNVSMSNTIIEVNIYYTSFGLPLTALGYNIIT